MEIRVVSWWYGDQGGEVMRWRGSEVVVWRSGW